MSSDIKPKSFQLVHLKLIDANTGESVEFMNLPADVEIFKSEPAKTQAVRHAADWPHQIADARPQFKISLKGETQPELSRVTFIGP